MSSVRLWIVSEVSRGGVPANGFGLTAVEDAVEKTMRKPILTIFYQFDPWNSSIGGIQTVVRNFIKFAPSEFEVRLVGITSNNEDAVNQWEQRQLDGRTVNFFPLFRLMDDDRRRVFPTTLRYTLALWGKKFQSDFMHFHRLEPSLMSMSWEANKTLFIHNDIHSQIQADSGKNGGILWQYFPSAYFALEGFLVRQFERIYSCNSNSANLYRGRYPDISHRVSFIKNTVDNSIFYPYSREQKIEVQKRIADKLGLPRYTKFVLFAGRLHPQKDPLLLIRSMAVLQEPDVHLLIAGKGELEDSIRHEIAQLGLAKSVTMLGSLPQSELAELQRISSVFVLTSAYEGLPLVALESLASGTPVVTTDSGETPSLLTPSSGVVCKERTPKEVAGALRQVLSSPHLYPSKDCVQAASPYSAREVINEIYADMLSHWKNASREFEVLHS